MSGRVASVFVDGGDGSLRLVGTAYFHGYGKGLRTVFSYASEWIQANDGFALSPQAPLQICQCRERESPCGRCPACCWLGWP